MKLADIQEIAAITKRKKFFCSRQYFCNALLQKPLDLGADIVMHSATKYLEEHSDVIAGYINY
jgi:cystathionine beta-lyase/cystathionine gamma-synthase